MKATKVTVLLMALTIVFSGCKGKVDENTPIEQVKAEAAKLFEAKNIDKLKSVALNLKEQIVDKTEELKPISDKISQIDITKLIGPEADKVKKELETLKTEAGQIRETISSLKDRFQIYYDKLIELKADISDIKL